MSDKQADLERKKADVRKRMEEQSNARKKKGFMTPERKKKLRLLLRKKAAEELKKEQERKATERRRVIDQRCGKQRPVDGLSKEQLLAMCKEYQAKICEIESHKYDTEKEVEYKDYMINELNIAVNDLRGKFIKPTLKKVSKYENKFAKLQKKAAEFNFRNQLKTVKKKEFTMDEEEHGEHKKPDWALGEKEGKSKSTSEAPAEAVEGDEVKEVAAEPMEQQPVEEAPIKEMETEATEAKIDKETDAEPTEAIEADDKISDVPKDILNEETEVKPPAEERPIKQEDDSVFLNEEQIAAKEDTDTVQSEALPVTDVDMKTTEESQELPLPEVPLVEPQVAEE